MTSPSLSRTDPDRPPLSQISENEGTPLDPASPGGMHIAARPSASPNRSSKYQDAPFGLCESPVATPTGQGKKSVMPASGCQVDVNGSAWLNQGFSNACSKNVGLLQSVDEQSPGIARDSMADVSWQDRFKNCAQEPRASVLLASTTLEDLDGSSDEECGAPDLYWDPQMQKKIEMLDIDSPRPSTALQGKHPVSSPHTHPTRGSARRLRSPDGSRATMLPRYTPGSSSKKEGRSPSRLSMSARRSSATGRVLFEFDSIAKEANNVCKEIFEEEIAEIRGVPGRESVQLNLEGEFGTLLAAVCTPRQDSRETGEQLAELEASSTMPCLARGVTEPCGILVTKGAGAEESLQSVEEEHDEDSSTIYRGKPNSVLPSLPVAKASLGADDKIANIKHSSPTSKGDDAATEATEAESGILEQSGLDATRTTEGMQPCHMPRKEDADQGTTDNPDAQEGNKEALLEMGDAEPEQVGDMDLQANPELATGDDVKAISKEEKEQEAAEDRTLSLAGTASLESVRPSKFHEPTDNANAQEGHEEPLLETGNAEPEQVDEAGPKANPELATGDDVNAISKEEKEQEAADTASLASVSTSEFHDGPSSHALDVSRSKDSLFEEFQQAAADDPPQPPEQSVTEAIDEPPPPPLAQAVEAAFERDAALLSVEDAKELCPEVLHQAEPDSTDLLQSECDNLATEEIPCAENRAAVDTSADSSFDSHSSKEESQAACDGWMAGACTNAVFGDDIRASVQVTTMDSALRACSVTPEARGHLLGLQSLVSLAEEEEEAADSSRKEEEHSDPSAVSGESKDGGTGEGGGPPAEGGDPARGDVEEMMELLMLGDTPPPGNASAGSKLPSPDGEIVDSFLKSLGPEDGGILAFQTTPVSPAGDTSAGPAQSPPATAVVGAEDLETIPATVAQADGPPVVGPAPSPLSRVDLCDEFSGVAISDAAPGIEPKASEPDDPEHVPDQSPVVAELSLPPSWARLAGSYGDHIDASMVLTGISMALPSSSSPQGDALDVEQPDAAGAGDLGIILEESSMARAPVLASEGCHDEQAVPVLHGEALDKEAAEPASDLDNIFQESAALGEILEQDAGNDAEAKAASHASGAVKASTSAEFSLGCAAPGDGRPSRKTSRLQAPRSSFHFFDSSKGPAPQDRAKDSKSIDDLFKVVTPVRFRTGTSQRADEPRLHASYEPQISGKKAVRNKALYPGGMSCPGPFFSLMGEEDLGPSSPCSWLFPVHPLAKPDEMAMKAGKDQEDATKAGNSRSSFSAGMSHDAPLSLHRASDSERAVRRVQRGPNGSGATPTDTEVTGLHNESLKSSVDIHPLPADPDPEAKQAACSPAAALSGSSDRAFQAQPAAACSSGFIDVAASSASAGSGVLFVNPSASAPAAALPKAKSSAGSFNKMLNKGVSRLRKPSLIAKPAPDRPEQGVVQPGAEQELGALLAKRTFSWGRAAASPAHHVASAPGKRRRKCEVLEAEAALRAPPTPHSMKKLAGSALKKIATPLSGIKKTASRLLATSKQPHLATRGDDLSATLDIYANKSPRTGLHSNP